MNTRINRRRFAIAVGGAVAVCSVGTAFAVADSNASEPASPAGHSAWADQSDVALWARVNGLAGLSPAGLTVAQTRSASTDQSAVAAWARANGLTGLSPAAMTAAPVRSASTDQTELATWARANGLTGLSPASLHRIED